VTIIVMLLAYMIIRKCIRARVRAGGRSASGEAVAEPGGGEPVPVEPQAGALMQAGRSMSTLNSGVLADVESILSSRSGAGNLEWSDDEEVFEMETFV